MWKVYKWNGIYIQGDLISQHKTESAALKKAKKEINFTYSVNLEDGLKRLINWRKNHLLEHFQS